MDWALYWFMFPVSVCIATIAMLSGIGGAALFVPIFVIIFPLLGPEYPLHTAAAIGTALMTVVFGFASGFVGYYRKRLIDFRSALPFIFVAVPVVIVGSLMLAVLKEYESFLKGAYAVLMLILCPVILRQTPPAMASHNPSDDASIAPDNRPVRHVTAKSGETYSYQAPRQGVVGGIITSTGAFLTGLLGVGIGEVIMPQLVKRNRIPVAIAAATSVYITIVTIASASFTQIAALIAAGGVNALPWNLVCYTIPGVIIGGQIGPWMQGKIARQTVEKVMAVLFSVIGIAMMWIAIA